MSRVLLTAGTTLRECVGRSPRFDVEGGLAEEGDLVGIQGGVPLMANARGLCRDGAVS